jgi:hypothetical protein
MSREAKAAARQEAALDAKERQLAERLRKSMVVTPPPEHLDRFQIAQFLNVDDVAADRMIAHADFPPPVRDGLWSRDAVRSFYITHGPAQFIAVLPLLADTSAMISGTQAATLLGLQISEFLYLVGRGLLPPPTHVFPRSPQKSTWDRATIVATQLEFAPEHMASQICGLSVTEFRAAIKRGRLPMPTVVSEWAEEAAEFEITATQEHARSHRFWHIETLRNATQESSSWKTHRGELKCQNPQL